MELHPCARCARHVRADASRCPFCETAAAPASPRRPRIVAQVTRAMVFYAGALTACAEPPVEPPAPVAAVEVIAPMAPADAPPEEPAPRPPAATPVAVTPEPEPRAIALAERRHAESQKNPPRVIQQVIIPPWDHACCPPYGAPPADTLV